MCINTAKLKLDADVYMSLYRLELICHKTKRPELNQVEKAIESSREHQRFADVPLGCFMSTDRKNALWKRAHSLPSSETDLIQPRLVADIC